MGDKRFLDTLSTEDRAYLRRHLTVELFTPDQFVLTQDERSNDVFFVLSGVARATIFSVDGRVIALREIPAGEIFGELSAIDNAPRSASVVAIEDIEVGRLGRAQFVELVEQRPGFTWALLRYFASRSRQMTERIYQFSTMIVRERLIEELIRLGENAQNGNGRVEIRPAPTHLDLAARISTHREAVSREMSKLSKQRAIARLTGGALRLNLDRLRAQRAERASQS